MILIIIVITIMTYKLTLFLFSLHIKMHISTVVQCLSRHFHCFTQTFDINLPKTILKKMVHPWYKCCFPP